MWTASRWFISIHIDARKNIDSLLNHGFLSALLMQSKKLVMWSYSFERSISWNFMDQTAKITHHALKSLSKPH